jgi:hypothetical protein
MALRAAFGERAVRAGAADLGRNGSGADGVETDAADAVTNILHWVEDGGGDISLVLARAEMNYAAERADLG